VLLLLLLLFLLLLLVLLLLLLLFLLLLLLPPPGRHRCRWPAQASRPRLLPPCACYAAAACAVACGGVSRGAALQCALPTQLRWRAPMLRQPRA
jgi:O-antigen/teichoic acid export membrane protein